MGWRATAVIVWTCTLLCMPAGARAQSERYDQLIAEAVAAFEAERFDEARGLFTEAHALVPNPRTLRGIGMCAIEQADFTTAHHVLAEALQMPPGEHPLTPALHAQVETMLREADARVAVFTGIPAEATVIVDGAPPALRDGDGAVAIAEGEHTVELRMPDGRHAESRVVAVGGERTLFPIDHASLARSAREGTPTREALAPTASTSATATSSPMAPTSQTAIASPPMSAEPSRVRIVAAEIVDEPAPRRRDVAIELALHLGGGGRNGGHDRLYGSFGGGLSFAVSFRIEAGIWLGAQLRGVVTGLTEASTASFAAMLESAQTRAWVELDAQLRAQVHFTGLPLAAVVALGYGSVFRDATQLDLATGIRGGTGIQAHAFTATLGLRAYLVDDRVFAGAEVHTALGDLPGLEAGLVLGGAPL